MKRLPCALSAVLMLAVTLVLALPAAASFSDVERGRWSESYIDYAVKKGFLKGVGDGKFDPEEYDGMSFFTVGGTTVIEDLKIYGMRSIR